MNKKTLNSSYNFINCYYFSFFFRVSFSGTACVRTKKKVAADADASADSTFSTFRMKPIV